MLLCLTVNAYESGRRGSGGQNIDGIQSKPTNENSEKKAGLPEKRIGPKKLTFWRSITQGWSQSYGIPSNFPHKLKARHIAEGSSSPGIGVERPVLDAAPARESIHESTAWLGTRAGAPARVKGVGR